MKQPLYWIDAFTARPFHGNPAGVCPLKQWLPAEQMQQLAFEHGLSETAFIVPTAENRYHLRWFTPVLEVDLCGHATLATAHVLFHELGLKGERVLFDSRSGPLAVELRGDKLELDFPARPAETTNELPAVLASATGHSPVEWRRAGNSFLAIYERATDVLALRPDFAQLRTLGSTRLIATAPGDNCDFVSRYFASGAGIDEDPVTGSAHCTLVPYWAARLGKTTLHARQLSARGGELWCSLAGDRVRIAGHAVTYLRGEIELP